MRLMVVAALVLVALAGCADDDGDGDDGGTTTPTTTPTTPASPSPTPTTTPTPTPEPRDPVTWEVEVVDNAFEPSELTIQVGDTVRWTQTGTNPHTVTSADDDFDSHPDCRTFADAALGNCMAEGDTYELTFDDAGTYDYFCRIHGTPDGTGMAGSIQVLEQSDGTP